MYIAARSCLNRKEVEDTIQLILYLELVEILLLPVLVYLRLLVSP